MKNYHKTIGLLTCSAAVLLTLNLLVGDRSGGVARANDSVSDQDFSLVTARTPQGGDALYVMEKRSGKMVVLTWDPSAKSMVVRASGNMTGGR